MELGLHLANLTWPDGPQDIAEDLAVIARTAESVGFATFSVPDRLWQTPTAGPAEQGMVEAAMTLSYVAGHTDLIELQAWVTAASSCEPGVLVKAVTTLDVLSGGRASLGVDGDWSEEEPPAPGQPFPSAEEHFERIEETLQVCLRTWGESDTRTLDAPESISRPHPPITIGGGDPETLRLVARYAQACALLAGPDLDDRFAILRRHCEEAGRDYDSVQKTVMMSLDPGENGEKADELLERLRGLAALGVTHVHGTLPGPSVEDQIRSLVQLDHHVIPKARKFRRHVAPAVSLRRLFAAPRSGR